MEGRHALPRVSTKGHLPLMCFMAFCGGVVYEATLCLTGFYNVYSYKAAEKTAQKKLEDEDFWVRVRARREAKQAAGLIKPEE